ncbi:MAG: T9SS type A sorting domain-containing protein [Bacteroidetes bacterium]|nr:T9SS type A sorting domain-containing protein [Bacteroidota bacterium]
MKKILTLLVSLISFAITGFPQTTFQRAIGTSGTDNIRDIKQTSDGGFIAVGSMPASSATDVLVIRTNSSGDTLWTKGIGTSGGSDFDDGYSVDITSDGGFIIAGSSEGYGSGAYSQVYLIRLNNAGSLLWSKIYGTTASVNSGGYGVQQTTDGGFVIAGGSPFGNCIIKTDSNGDTLWTRTLSGGVTALKSIRQTNDGGYVVAGAGFGAGSTDFYWAKLNSAGNYLWSKTYGAASFDECYSIIQTSEGGYLISGYSNVPPFGYDAILVKTNSIGDTTWVSRFHGGWDDYCYSANQTPDGGYILSGKTRITISDYDACLVKVNSSGTAVQWAKRYGTTSLSPGENFNYVSQTSDGGYAAAGWANTFGAGSAEDGYLVKTNSAGATNICHETNTTFTRYSRSGTITNPATTSGYAPFTVISFSSAVKGTGTVYKNLAVPVSGFSFTKTDRTATFTNTTADLSSYTYLWDFGDGTASSSQNPVHNYAVAGNYNVCLTATAACGSNSICKNVWLSVPQTKFQRAFGGSNSDIGRSIHRNTDGSYIIAGETQSFGSGMQDIYLLQMNTNGGLNWSKTFGSTNSEAGYSVTEHIAGGGNYLLAAQSGAFAGGDALIMTVSTGGGLLWSQAFGGASGDYPYSIIETSDGKFVTAGYTRSLPSGYESMHIMKISDITGDTVWTRGFDDAFNEGYGYDVKQTSDGGYIVTGETWANGPREVYAVKMTSSGAVSWKKSIPSGTGYSVAEVNGGYVITGDESTTSADVLLVKIDNSGNLLWKKTYGGSGSDIGYVVKQTPDKGFIIGGYTQGSFNNNSDAYLLRTDSDGGLLWSKTYGGTWYDYAYSVDLAADGGYILTGETGSFGAGNKDVYVIKTDTLGSSGSCNETNPPTIVSSSSPAASAVGGTIKYLGTKNGSGAVTVSPSTVTSYPSQVSIAYSVMTPVTCFGSTDGNVNAFSVIGGTTPYTYNWNTGGTTNIISNLPSGSYSLSVYDQNGCSGNISATITDPPNITYTVSSTNVTCNGFNNGTITISAAGGTGALTYWDAACACYQPSNILSSLSPATYTVIVKDANNCTKSSTVTITQPNVLAVSNTITNITCNAGNNGAINITTSGGTFPYTFNWSPVGLTTEDISGLTVGNYSLSVTDANGCTKNQTYLINQPPAIAASISVTNVNCNGGSNGTANVSVSVGVFPFTYQWDAFAGSQTAQVAVGLSAGTYSVVVTDADGCTGTFSTTITQPAVLTSTITPTNVVCNGGSNGSVNLSVSGGTSPYTFSWSTAATTQNISNLPAGNYSVSVTDSKGCVTTNSVTVGQPPLLTSTINKTDVTCNGLCNGTATANPSGGTPPYFYSWQTSPTQTTQTATGLCPTIYNVNISDNNNCQITPNVTITQPNVLTVLISITDATCNNTDGSATANPTGGTSPFTYNWSNGNSNQTANNLLAGNYSVAITDVNGCTATAAATVSVISTPQPICIVTVDSFSIHNQIVWEKPANAPIDSFRIYREVASVFTPVVTLPYSSLSLYTDTTTGVNPNITAYRYKMSAIDSCGNESVLSSYHRTMHLQIGPAIPPASFNLSWNDYEGITITQYRIMRDSAFTGWKAVDSVSFGTNAWTDINTYPVADTISFYLEIDHQTGCTSSIKNLQPMATNLNTSRSNVYRVQDSTQVSVNTILNVNDVVIYPNPSNGKFNVQMSRFENVQMKIYNVYGECIYQHICTSAHQQIDLSKQSKGVYYLQITSSDKVLTKKIIIE